VSARHRVECACGWSGYRRRPHARPCPSCGLDGAKLEATWLAGAGPRRGRACYLVEISPPFRHAAHYLGFTSDLPRRWAEHRAGQGARLLSAAVAAGCRLELVRVWYGSQARALEQQLKQRRKPGSTRCGARTSLRRLCPQCNPDGWARRHPNIPDPPRPGPRWHRFRHDPEVWDAEAEWDAAFPALAYGPAGGAS
jgi:predicted GIY-YIG superfamily endonuclease